MRKKVARKRTARKSAKRVPSNAAKLHQIIKTDAAARHKLYAAFNRVRCYLYKYGKSKPKPETAKKIEKLTGGRVAANAW